MSVGRSMPTMNKQTMTQLCVAIKLKLRPNISYIMQTNILQKGSKQPVQVQAMI